MANQFPRPSESLGEPLTIVRAQVEQPGVNQLGEAQFALPTNPSNNIGFLVRRVHMDLEPPIVGIPLADNINLISTQGALSTRQGLAALPSSFSDGLIARVELITYIASQLADSGITMSQFYEEGPDADFSIGGLLTATRAVSVYVGSSALVTNVLSLVVVMYGHIVQITPDELVAALSTEVGI